MKQATLIQFRLPRKEKKVSMGAACRVYRRLYGYDNVSYYGRYRSRVPGLLDEIPSIRYPGSMIMVREEDASKVLRLLREAKAETHTWTVVPRKTEAKRLGLG
jgi:hypothetical protein